MSFIYSILFILLSAPGAWAHVHSLDSALHAVEKNHADTKVLVYKVKDKDREIMNQGWRPTLMRNADFTTAPMFRRLSNSNSKEVQTLANQSKQDMGEFGRYYVRYYPAALDHDKAQKVLKDLYAEGNIEFAYFEPLYKDAVALERMQAPPLAQTPLAVDDGPGNFESQQFHLNPAPEGVDARYAWALAGGTGKDIRIIDVETGWHPEHYEFGPVWYDNHKNGLTDHGTAVWGEVAARPDGKGVTGIAYDVTWGMAGNGFSGGFDQYPKTIAAVIEDAALQLQAGDLIIIEQHAPLVDDYGPIEYFEPVFKALQLATAKGVHCVAAGGNGYSNLDDPKYNNLFDVSVRDSGCVMVGAVDSPKSARVRQRSDFSNYGKRIDAFGYGGDVVTSGYGDLLGGNYQGKLATYTSQFSGTSSATPIVAGTVASVLGIAKAKGVIITPAQMREALRNTGTHQEGKNKDNERVGNLPNIPEILQYLRLI